MTALATIAATVTVTVTVAIVTTVNVAVDLAVIVTDVRGRKGHPHRRMVQAGGEAPAE